MEDTIASHHRRCYTDFIQVLAFLQGSNHRFADSISLPDASNEFDRYKLWCSNVGAAHDGQNYRISLDYRLREAPFWKEQICSILIRLAETLERTSSLLQGASEPFEAQASPKALSVTSQSETSSSEEEEEEEEEEDDDCNAPSESERQKLARVRAAVIDLVSLMEPQISTIDPWLEDQHVSLSRRPTSEMPQLLDSMRFTISCLYRIPIRRPATADRLKKIPPTSLSHFDPFDAKYIDDRCPTASDELKQRLKKMTSNRRHLLEYRACHHKNIKPTARITRGPLIESDINASRTEQTHQTEKGHSEVQSSRPSQISKATTLKIDDFPNPPPNIFALDNVSVAESAPSSRASSWTGSQKLYVPPRPKASSGGNAFLCPYCFVICKAKSDHNWKHHVLRDLEPYICTFDDCDTKDQQFDHRDEWYEHELQHHRIEWCCNANGHPPHGTRSSFLEHLKTHHSELYLAVQIPEMIRRFQRPKQDHTSACPICSKFAKKPKSHLSRHMEQLALYILGGNNQDDSEAESNASNDAKRAGSSDGGESDEDSLGWDETDQSEPSDLLPSHVDEPVNATEIPDAVGDSWETPLDAESFLALVATLIRLLDFITILCIEDKHGHDNVPGFLAGVGSIDKWGNSAFDRLKDLTTEAGIRQDKIGFLTSTERAWLHCVLLYLMLWTT